MTIFYIFLVNNFKTFTNINIPSTHKNSIERFYCLSKSNVECNYQIKIEVNLKYVQEVKIRNVKLALK